MTPKISVIVPVYNLENYISKCVESILCQSYTNLELILVDDGSTDRSCGICQQYAALDSRVRLIHQENQGVSAARNRGLEVASGDWIGFVDADDSIAPDYYETMISASACTHAEIICCGVRAMDEAGRDQPFLLTTQPPASPTLLTLEQTLTHFLHPGKRYLYWPTWDKLIRGDIARKYRFEVGRKFGEDFFYSFQCILDSHGVYYIPDKKYNYVLRSGSATRSKTVTPANFDIIYFAQKVWEQCASQGLSQWVVQCADMNRLVVNARAVRTYYQAADYREKEKCSQLAKQCRNRIRQADRSTKQSLGKKYQLLLWEAAYCPILFHIR